MEKKIKDLEENASLLQKKSDLLENILEKRDKERAEVLDNLEEKEKQIHQLKLEGNGICENGCHKYNKSMDDVVKAGFKHKGDVIAMKEVAENLRKKIYKLKDENRKIFEEKKQHEEDAIDGYEMLQNVRERERLMKIKFEGELVKKDTEIKALIDERVLIDDLKDSIERKKKVSDKVIKDLQVENENLVRINIEHMKVVDMKASVYQNEISDLLIEIKEIQKINSEKEEMLLQLENENDELKLKLKKTEEEHFEYIKRTEIEKVQFAENDKTEQISTVKSLEEELENFQLEAKFKCKYCDETRGSRSAVKQHIANVHSKDALLKLAELEQRLFNQAAHFTSSGHALMKREISGLKKPCVCKHFCVINHMKHNWTKPAADDIFKRFTNLRS